ncbi:MAG TPA: DUF6655 family protein [Pirellulales bacterium]|nr:DUF6655 family protein [Pirellulales bacterium]
MQLTTSTLRLVWLLLMIAVAGCGTTRMSDTMRTGTEQMLISTAIDRSINEMNFAPLAGKTVYLDPQYLRGVVDEGYIISSLRQHLLANGCLLREVREEAIYVVEARSGAVGTNRHDVLLGVPSINLPSTGLPGVPAQIPEIPFAKSTHQKGIAKLAVFVYNQESGTPVWQSGAIPIAASSRDTWILGTGPFQRGSIYQGTGFAGSRLLLPFSRERQVQPRLNPAIPVTAQASFQEKPALASKEPAKDKTPGNDGDPPKVARRTSTTFTPLAPVANQTMASTAGGGQTSTTSIAGTPAAPGMIPSTAVSGGNGAGVILMGAVPWLQGGNSKR